MDSLERPICVPDQDFRQVDFPWSVSIFCSGLAMFGPASFGLAILVTCWSDIALAAYVFKGLAK